MSARLGYLSQSGPDDAFLGAACGVLETNWSHILAKKTPKLVADHAEVYIITSPSLVSHIFCHKSKKTQKPQQIKKLMMLREKGPGGGQTEFLPGCCLGEASASLEYR